MMHYRLVACQLPVDSGAWVVSKGRLARSVWWSVAIGLGPFSGPSEPGSGTVAAYSVSCVGQLDLFKE